MNYPNRTHYRTAEDSLDSMSSKEAHLLAHQILDTVSRTHNVRHLDAQTRQSPVEPKPLSILNEQSYLLNFISDEKKRTQLETQLNYWAEIDPHSPSSLEEPAAYIGGYEFSYEQLHKLRSWVETAIMWHDLRNH